MVGSCETDHSENLCVDGSVMLKFVLKKEETVWTGFI
jgi:hypothetical protein